MARIVITPPMFGHAPVSAATIAAAQQGVAALPAAMRKTLDATDARIILSPNLIDRWPDSLKDLPETSRRSHSGRAARTHLRQGYVHIRKSESKTQHCS